MTRQEYYTALYVGFLLGAAFMLLVLSIATEYPT
jgi:hypothetical protein